MQSILFSIPFTNINSIIPFKLLRTWLVELGWLSTFHFIFLCLILIVVVNLFCRCTYLYDTLRPKLIHETNIDTLCELVDILKVEVLGEQLSRRTESLAGLRPTLDRILADVHERLTFRARTHIRDEVDIAH